MEKIIIFGIGDFANQLFRYISVDNRYKVVAFTVEEEFRSIDSLFDLPVLSFDDIQDYYSPVEYKMLVCIGYNNMNKTRARVFDCIKNKGYSVTNYIHPLATVLSREIGYGNIILENANIGIGCKIGNGNILYNNAVICHDVSVGDYNFFAPTSCVLGFARIGNQCFLGAHSTIRNNISLGDECLVGANSFVSNNLLSKSVVVPQRSGISDKLPEEITI